jgi:diguanylate cyclase (GGDEF)-like protein
MPEADIEGAWIFAETIRRKIEGQRFDCNGTILNVTVCIGGAALTEEMKGPEDLIAAADERLYEAKRAGRNRVVL